MRAYIRLCDHKIVFRKIHEFRNNNLIWFELILHILIAIFFSNSENFVKEFVSVGSKTFNLTCSFSKDILPGQWPCNVLSSILSSDLDSFAPKPNVYSRKIYQKCSSRGFSNNSMIPDHYRSLTRVSFYNLLKLNFLILYLVEIKGKENQDRGSEKWKRKVG